MTNLAVASLSGIGARWSGAIRTTGVTTIQALVAAVSQLVLFAVAARALSPSDFGLWTALATVATWLTLSDLGLNKAVTTSLAASSSPRQLASNAFFLQGAIAWPLAVLALVGLTPQSLPLGLTAAIILAVSPFSVARAMLSGAQRGWVPAYWDIGGSAFVLLLSAMIAPRMGLTGMTLIAASGLFVSRLLGGLWLWQQARPSLTTVDWPHATGLWKIGRHFVLAQGADLLLMQGLPWIAVVAVGAAQAGPFSSAARLVAFLPVAAFLFANALIPAYADANARRDRAWIGSALNRTVVCTLGIALPIVSILGLSLPDLLKAWISSAAEIPSRSALLWLAAWAGVQCALAPLLAYLYGIGRPAFAARWNLVSALVGLAAGWKASSIWGASGLAAALCLAQMFLYLMPLAIHVRRQRAEAQP